MGKREDILNATMTIIADQGVMHATIANILKQASTGYGTLYNYFDSKEDLYRNLYIQIIEGIDAYVQKGIPQISDNKILLVQVLSRYLDYCLDNVKAFYALEALRYVPDICLITKADVSFEGKFFELLKACESEGIIKKRDPHYNLNMLMGIIATFVKFYYLNPYDVTEEKKKEMIQGAIKALNNQKVE